MQNNEISSEEVSYVSRGPASQKQAIKPPCNARAGHSFVGISQLLWSKLSPAAQYLVQSLVIPSLAIHIKKENTRGRS